MGRRSFPEDRLRLIAVIQTAETRVPEAERASSKHAASAVEQEDAPDALAPAQDLATQDNATAATEAEDAFSAEALVILHFKIKSSLLKSRLRPSTNSRKERGFVF